MDHLLTVELFQEIPNHIILKTQALKCFKVFIILAIQKLRPCNVLIIHITILSQIS